jgi:hypothetical protein
MNGWLDGWTIDCLPGIPVYLFSGPLVGFCKASGMAEPSAQSGKIKDKRQKITASRSLGADPKTGGETKR